MKNNWPIKEFGKPYDTTFFSRMPILFLVAGSKFLNLLKK